MLALPGIRGPGRPLNLIREIGRPAPQRHGQFLALAAAHNMRGLHQLLGHLLRRATQLTALSLRNNRLCGVADELAAWRPDGWARFEMEANRFAPAVARSLRARGVDQG